MSLSIPAGEQQPQLSAKPHHRHSTGDSSDNDTLPVERPFPKEQLQDIARSLSRHSQPGTPSPFHADEDSELNPNSPNFNARAWAESMLRLRDGDPNNLPRTAGFAFRNLSAYGYGSSLDFQDTVSNLPWQLAGLASKLAGNRGQRIDILQSMDALVRPGEMLVVLGPPGSGCTTLLKTIAGEIDGYNVEADLINYSGISQKTMNKDFRGEAIYTAEVDVHFPALSVGDTLDFASRARAPRVPPGGVSQKDYARHMRDVVMTLYGISHTINTKVGNDFIRGVSGGERKRVTISEATLSGAPLQCWDNSTRGLDSANAVEFCRNLRLQCDLANNTAVVAIYQAPQSAYDVFDKVSVLYKGRQIYFGKTTEAKKFFTDMGFYCPDRQTTADFLTSLTSDLERRVQPEFEGKTPVTPEEFEARWKASHEYKALLREIEEYNAEHEIGGSQLEQFRESRRAQQAKRQRIKSPYTLSYGQQIKLCMWRGFKLLLGNPELTLTQLFGNFAMALIIGSVFYNLQPVTSSFFPRGSLLFFAILLAAFASALEILTLYAQRPIVEKHTRYAFYHPSAEAFASMACDMPYKTLNAILFSLTLYFMTNLNRTPGAYFFFLLITFTCTIAMSMFFRTIGAASRTLAQALAPAAVLILALIIYTGFVIPTRDMLGWSRWINYLNPIAYGFEALMVNEFHNRQFRCDQFVPSGAGYPSDGSSLGQICSARGAVAGSAFVNGTDFVNTSYQYYYSHRWRNFGILCAFAVFLMCTYLAASELISAKKSKGEVLVFQRETVKKIAKEQKKHENDPELGGATVRQVSTQKDVAMIPKQTSIFQWEDVVYELVTCLPELRAMTDYESDSIKIKGEPRRILNHVDGWVKPGTLTALMGVSGAGKTTLLDVLATRVTMGVVTGKMLVDGEQRDDSFQRKTGYVQQQDLHLATSTVREALRFSALLRQPAEVSKREKLDYVEEVIDLLDMRPYADAVVGVPGEGLNVEQRKRLTIGVELAAKPQLLLFLDEPTSGLDSQTSWAICDLLTKLAEHGQAILCTIHQPSAMLFQRFDRLLFLKKGGETVYFGEVGEGAKVLTAYFERNGAKPCPPDANPAEWMLEVIGAAPGTKSDTDWYTTWRESPEYQEVKAELRRLEQEGRERRNASSNAEKNASSNDDGKHHHKGASHHKEFAAPFGVQYLQVQKRVFQQYWRSPSYIYSKFALCTMSGLFIGFSFFKAPTSQQGLQNQLFGIFMLLTIFGNLVQQIMPQFATQRALYESRERPSKAYSWQAWLLAQIVVELPFNLLVGAILFFTIYYPVGFYQNAVPTNTVHERGALFFLLVESFLLFTSTFTHMMISGIESVETAGNIANLLFSMSLIFCGVLQSKSQLPGFWLFMYYISPFTYIVEGLLATGLSNTQVTCSDIEYLQFQPAQGQTCSAYMSSYISSAGGYLQNPDAMQDCSFCAIRDTSTFLSSFSIKYSHRWRDWGILWAYILFNVAAAVGIYWLARVPKKTKVKETAQAEDEKTA